ncbi:MAG: hypothetical protein AB8B70_08465 [Prochlorococcus sp.]
MSYKEEITSFTAMAETIEIMLEPELVAWLDYYCSIYGVERSDAASHLLQGALQTALPNPVWLELAQSEAINSFSAAASAEIPAYTPHIEELQPPKIANSENELGPQRPNQNHTAARSAAFDTLKLNPLVQRRHQFKPS